MTGWWSPLQQSERNKKFKNDLLCISCGEWYVQQVSVCISRLEFFYSSHTPDYEGAYLLNMYAPDFRLAVTLAVRTKQDF